MIVVRDKDFRIVGFSRNMRGVISRSRKVTLERVDIWPRAGAGAQVGMAWADGSSAIFDFADASVAKHFFESRRRWPEPTYHSQEQS